MLAGQTLGGRYDVLELIASGGMGEVYRARDRELDELVALKVIRSDLADAAMMERFRAEVKLARRVTHANVARTFELGYADGVMFCTMELVEGETLAQRIALRHRLTVAEAVGIACAVCDALIAAHAANVIHRDIKPANILIAGDGRVVLADFGIAAANVQAQEATGTPSYMAPEQARGEPATPAIDVYAVGVVLYEMLSGQRAFSGSLAQIVDAKQIARLVPTGGEVSAELGDVVARATASDPTDRIPSATELRRALAPWATADMLAAQPLRRVPPRAMEDRTIIVIAPRVSGEAGELLYVATEIHEQLLAELGRSTFRVLPRTEETLSDARAIVRLAVTDQLVLDVSTSDAPAFSVTLPLAVDQIRRAVVIAAAAIHGALGAPPTAAHVESDPAHVLLLRARQVSRLGPPATPQAIELLERASELVPDDARILAFHGILLARYAFFTADADGSLLRRAGEMVRRALAKDGSLADAHLAAGHYELHTGDPAIAAGHYRVALGCAPYLAEAHEHLGRVLTEAGYLDAGLARFAEAVAIAPHYSGIQWEVARAMALERRWDEFDQIFARIDLSRRLITKARVAAWRGDHDLLRATRAEAVDVRDDEVLVYIDVFLDGTWAAVGPRVVAAALEPAPSRRRGLFVAQLVAEAAAFAGDRESCLRVLEHASSLSLFDLHWLDKVPMFDGMRELPEFVAIRTRVEARARGIYDALYGDHAVAMTELATS